MIKQSNLGQSTLGASVLKTSNLRESQAEEEKDIEERILYTNPVLEAFGNAKTIRNDNSSRFGKFIELYFEEKNSMHFIHSAQIINYLLEKSRITYQQENERNYHIFYMLVHAAPESLQDQLEIDEDFNYNYLNENYDRKEQFEEEEKANWIEMLDCMEGLKFTEEHKSNLFEIVGAVLHLGQVEFDGDDSNSSLNKKTQNYKRCARLLGIEVSYMLFCQKSSYFFLYLNRLFLYTTF